MERLTAKVEPVLTYVTVETSQDPEGVQCGPGCRELAPVARPLQEPGVPRDTGHYTLHPTLYTLHPAPYTLHSTPYTLNPTPYTLHPGEYPSRV